MIEENYFPVLVALLVAIMFYMFYSHMKFNNECEEYLGYKVQWDDDFGLYAYVENGELKFISELDLDLKLEQARQKKSSP